MIVCVTLAYGPCISEHPCLRISELPRSRTTSVYLWVVAHVPPSIRARVRPSSCARVPHPCTSGLWLMCIRVPLGCGSCTSEHPCSRISEHPCSRTPELLRSRTTPVYLWALAHVPPSIRARASLSIRARVRPSSCARVPHLCVGSGSCTSGHPCSRISESLRSCTFKLRACVLLFRRTHNSRLFFIGSPSSNSMMDRRSMQVIVLAVTGGRFATSIVHVRIIFGNPPSSS